MPRLLLKALTVAGLLALAASGCTPREAAPRFDDERPPIIIGDGSLDVYVDLDTKQQRPRGELVVKSAAGGQVLEHIVDAAQYPDTAPSRFDVFLVNADGSDACRNADTAFNVTSFTVDYGPSLMNSNTMTVAIDATSQNATLTLQRDSRPVKDVQKFWKGIGGAGDKLLRITFSPGGSCTFDKDAKHRGVITAFQRK